MTARSVESPRPSAVDAPASASSLSVGVVTPIPTPYRDAFWNVLARRPGIELTIYYCAEGKPDRPWQVRWRREFSAELLPGLNLRAWAGPTESCYWNPGLRRRLEGARHDVLLVGGYNHPTLWSALRFAWNTDTPYFLMCETYARPAGPLKRLLKRAVVGRVVRKAAGGLPTGSRAERYLRAYGADPASLCRVPNTPDIGALRRRVLELREDLPRLRLALGLADRPVILFAARLIPKKRPRQLLRAFVRSGAADSWQLVFVGDGDEREPLADQAEQLGLGESVRFVGAIEPERMPEYYAAADMFVLPSTETWGVGLVEALAADLYVVVSDQVGAQADLVRSREIGTVVQAGDELSLAGGLRAACRPALRRDSDAARARRRLLDDMEPSAVAERLHRALRRAVASVGLRNPARPHLP